VSAARDGVFLRELARVHERHGTPHVALVVGALVTSAVLSLVLFDSLLGAWTTVVAFSVLTSLVPHLVTCAAHVALSWRERRARPVVIGALGVAFTLFAILGLDGPTLARGALALALGLPAWAWFRSQRSR
jgi:basic amino acid/polyamine antiporter, APA family